MILRHLKSGKFKSLADATDKQEDNSGHKNIVKAFYERLSFYGFEIILECLTDYWWEKIFCLLSSDSAFSCKFIFH